MTGWLTSAYLCGYSARCACVTLYTRINMNPFLGVDPYLEPLGNEEGSGG